MGDSVMDQRNQNQVKDLMAHLSQPYVFYYFLLFWNSGICIRRFLPISKESDQFRIIFRVPYLIKYQRNHDSFTQVSPNLLNLNKIGGKKSMYLGLIPGKTHFSESPMSYPMLWDFFKVIYRQFNDYWINLCKCIT